MLLRTVRNIAIFTVLCLLGLGAAYVWAQAPQAPPPTCEQQLERVQRLNIELQKQKAQSDFRAAATEEQFLDLQKKQAEASPAKAAQSVPPTPKP